MTTTDALDAEVARAIEVRIVRFTPGFSVHKKGKAESDANRRFEIRKGRRGMSFVRHNREIETVDVFPRYQRWTWRLAVAPRLCLSLGHRGEVQHSPR